MHWRGREGVRTARTAVSDLGGVPDVGRVVDHGAYNAPAISGTGPGRNNVKVYVLTTGSYSDTSIVGVFSSREAAVAAGTGDSEVNDPEEYELDERAEHRYGPTWSVFFRKETGGLEPQRHAWQKIRHPSACEIQDNQYGIFVASPISAEHALKVAAEKRQEWLRMKAVSGS